MSYATLNVALHQRSLSFIIVHHRSSTFIIVIIDQHVMQHHRSSTFINVHQRSSTFIIDHHRSTCHATSSSSSLMLLSCQRHASDITSPSVFETTYAPRSLSIVPGSSSNVAASSVQPPRNIGGCRTCPFVGKRRSEGPPFSNSLPGCSRLARLHSRGFTGYGRSDESPIHPGN